MLYQFQEEIIFGDKEVLIGHKFRSHSFATIIPIDIYTVVFTCFYSY